eukprot:6182190-Pleurochrysis_carterae.AAC.3
MEKSFGRADCLGNVAQELASQRLGQISGPEMAKARRKDENQVLASLSSARNKDEDMHECCLNKNTRCKSENHLTTKYDQTEYAIVHLNLHLFKQYNTH